MILSDSCGYSHLVLHQNSTRGSSFSVSCNVESETFLVDFPYFVTLKSIGLSCTSNGSFAHVLFYNMQWLFPKY